ncbi:MAG: hypothetical protein JSR82_13035 [Verrucomicrobia bacterium]|nr:hypothetical protein [Verrucomicrobiota bacterium]
MNPALLDSDVEEGLLIDRRDFRFWHLQAQFGLTGPKSRSLAAVKEVNQLLNRFSGIHYSGLKHFESETAGCDQNLFYGPIFSGSIVDASESKLARPLRQMELFEGNRNNRRFVSVTNVKEVEVDTLRSRTIELEKEVKLLRAELEKKETECSALISLCHSFEANLLGKMVSERESDRTDSVYLWECHHGHVSEVHDDTAVVTYEEDGGNSYLVQSFQRNQFHFHILPPVGSRVQTCVIMVAQPDKEKVPDVEFPDLRSFAIEGDIYL